MNTLQNIIKTSFKKIRIRGSKIHPKLDALFHEKEQLRFKLMDENNSGSPEVHLDLRKKLESVEKEIASFCAEKNKHLVDSYLGKYNDTFEGYNQIKTWGLM